MKLGRLLWKAPAEEYGSSLLGKTLTLKGESEKNKLSAYIDVRWKAASEAEKQLLQEAQTLEGPIFDLGSKGKSDYVRHSEVRQLVLDTFRLVDLLRQATRLVPHETQVSAGPPLERGQFSSSPVVVWSSHGGGTSALWCPQTDVFQPRNEAVSESSRACRSGTSFAGGRYVSTLLVPTRDQVGHPMARKSPLPLLWARFFFQVR